MNYMVFPLDLVGSFGEQLAGGLFAQDKSSSICSCEQICWIRLPIAKLELYSVNLQGQEGHLDLQACLFNINRKLDLWDVLAYIVR